MKWRKNNMSAKNRDRQGRWRAKTVAFHVSEEENMAIDEAVALSQSRTTLLQN